jgi:hypothetical protein
MKSGIAVPALPPSPDGYGRTNQSATRKYPKLSQPLSFTYTQIHIDCTYILVRAWGVQLSGRMMKKAFWPLG